MKPPTTLFDFRFKGDLDGYYVRLLKEATGMLIGDVGNLRKDTPGRGQITHGVSIQLWRPTGEPNDWQLDATTWEGEYDEEAVEACRQRLLALLPQISQTWQEGPGEAVTGEPDNQAEPAGGPADRD